jgi:tetratricopeptide (TPR) repeat protein
MSGYFGDLERLLRHLDARLGSQPRYADVLNLRGLGRAHAGDLAGARSDLEAALGVNRDYAVARFNLAWLAMQLPPEEDPQANEVARELPAPAKEHLEILQLSVEQGPEAARRALERKATDSAWWDLDRLWLCVRARRWEDVPAAIARLTARDAEVASLLLTAGVLCEGRPDPELLTRWAASYAGNPHGAALCAVGSELAHAAGNLAESRRLLSCGVALSMDLCAYWTAMGTQWESFGEAEAASEALLRAVGADPSRVEPRIALGYSFAARGLPQEAITHLEVASRLAPGYADVRYQLGLLFGEVGRPADAEAELRAALDVQPEYVLGRLALGCLLESVGRNAEALALLQDVRRTGLSSEDLQQHLTNLEARCGSPQVPAPGLAAEGESVPKDPAPETRSR